MLDSFTSRNAIKAKIVAIKSSCHKPHPAAMLNPAATQITVAEVNYNKQ
ncbi:hypothetical protein [Myxosarcina sp. GI1]|nr:hypothetical protein [Myxosarcina sp. GI1]